MSVSEMGGFKATSQDIQYAFEVSIIEEGDKQRLRRTTRYPALVLTSGRRSVRAQVSAKLVSFPYRAPQQMSLDTGIDSVFSQSTAVPF